MKAKTLFVVFPFAVFAAESVENKSEIKIFEGKYAEMRAAMETRDPQKVMALLSTDFVSIDIQGNKEDGQRMAAEVGELLRDSTKKSETTVLSVDIKENKAVVRQQYHLSKKRIEKSGEIKPIELTTISQDEWIKRDGKWFVSKTETKMMDYKVSGKTVSHKEIK